MVNHFIAVTLTKDSQHFVVLSNEDDVVDEMTLIKP